MTEIELVKSVLKTRDVAHLSRVLKVAKKSIYRWVNGECKPNLYYYGRLLELHEKNASK